MSLAQVLIMFDQILFAILFFIAIFCVMVAVSASFSYSSENRKESSGEGERKATCYSIRTGGTVLLLDKDLENVV